MTSIRVLGTKYTIETHQVSEDLLLKEKDLYGYCDEHNKLIVVADFSDGKYYNNKFTDYEREYLTAETLRHEIIHAFLYESGLGTCSSKFEDAWVTNEEMIDWFAVQFPKIAKVYKKLGILNVKKQSKEEC